MAILTGAKIRQAVAVGDIAMNPYDPKRAGPNSYDLTLGPDLFRYVFGQHPSDVLDPTKQNEMTPIDSWRRDADQPPGWLLRPGVLYLGRTLEWCGSRKYVPLLEGRSSIGRLGIRVHATAGFGDLGFEGCWTLEIDVVHPVWLASGTRICQIAFHTTEGDVDQLYSSRPGSKYAGSKTVVGSRLHLDK